MSAPIDFDPTAFIVVESPGSNVAVASPNLIALNQVGTYVQAIVVLPPLTGPQPLTLLRIYRAPIFAGPWVLVDANPPSPISRYNNLFDLNPAIGSAFFYAATVVNALGTESARSNELSISAYSPSAI